MYIVNFCTYIRFVYKKPSSRPSTKSFLIFGHILVLKVSLKCHIHIVLVQLCIEPGNDFNALIFKVS